MAEHTVTHLCGAPIVMAALLATPQAEKPALAPGPKFITAGAPPPEAVLAAMQAASFTVCHVYGLTEVYGPAVVCELQAAWQALPQAQQAARIARQGVRYQVLEELIVADPATLAPVPAEGATMGEVFLRGNVVTNGYLKDFSATETAFAGGGFHTGDLAVLHPDGYIQLKDRAMDITISSGENISCPSCARARGEQLCSRSSFLGDILMFWIPWNTRHYGAATPNLWRVPRRRPTFF